jgi:phosphatidylglycerophosphatase A
MLAQRKVGPASGRWSGTALLASWFGSGYLPKAPGTWGSIAAVPFAWAIERIGGPVWLFLAAIPLFVLGWRAASAFVRAEGVQDPSWIVVDEVVGQWLTLAVAGRSPWIWLVALLAFRAADIVKPFPAGWADRNIGGGLGVMLDDVLAVPYAAGATLACRYLSGAA